MTEVTEFVAELPAWLKAIGALVAALAGIAALTKNKKDDRIIAKVRKVVDFLKRTVKAMNKSQKG